MKVLLLKDVYKLGRAGDVKRVANGYGRNYLLPQGLAVVATRGALKQVDRIKTQATIQRNALNEELGEVAEQLEGLVLQFTARASETGKLYGSISTQMIADALTEKTGVEVNKRQVYTQPVRTLGEHTVQIRLTVDLVPEIKVVVNREGEELEEVVIQEPVRPEVIEEPEQLQEEQDEPADEEELSDEQQVEIADEAELPEIEESEAVPDDETDLEDEVTEEAEAE
jgi:large subunit ribosomal protein L9